jgi:hypothetical protein
VQNHRGEIYCVVRTGGAGRALKNVQDVMRLLGLDIAFLYQEPASFQIGLAKISQTHLDLGAYLDETRAKWSERLTKARNTLEHQGWALPRVMYQDSQGCMEFLGVPWGLRPRRTEQKLALSLLSMLPSAHVCRVGVRIVCFRGSMATPPILYLRFAGSLAVAAQDSRPSGSLLLSCSRVRQWRGLGFE